MGIQTSSKICKTMAFPMKFQKEKNWCYFYRDGTSSMKVNDVKKFLDFMLPENAENRFDADQSLESESGDSDDKLTRTLCKNEVCINDRKYKYVLITNEVCKYNCCDSENSEMEWIKNIDWQVVFDFNPSSFDDGLGKMVMNSEDVLNPPNEVSIARLDGIFNLDPSIRNLKKSLEMDRKTSWIKCVNE